MRKMLGALLMALGLAMATACSRPEPEIHEKSSAQSAEWNVLKGGRPVLRIKNSPGPIVSRALIPPGEKPAVHPFLTASSLDPNEEHNLQLILERSKSFKEFVGLLKKNGYTLQPIEK